MVELKKLFVGLAVFDIGANAGLELDCILNLSPLKYDSPSKALTPKRASTLPVGIV